MKGVALVVASSAAAGVATHFLVNRSKVNPVMKKTLREAQKDLSKHITSADLEDDGPLAAIFADSGWSKRVDVRDGKVMDWCGMAVGAWLHRGGMRAEHRKSFWATENVRSFFSYAKKGTTHRRTELAVGGKPIEAAHAAAGAKRQWLEAEALRAIPWRELDIEAGDVVLIAHNGRLTGADHIALVEAFDGRYLTTLEGNASGKLADGRSTASGVVRKQRDLANAATRNTLFGVGRLSKLDFV